MLKHVKDTDFNAPFKSGLEYSCSARGPWNIVHTGMLIPEAHEIFVCAAGCLRGVVLTAAEMNASNRFSTIEIREHNVMEGDMEELIIDGVDDILNKLNYKPRAVLVYTSCIHHFIGCDLKLTYDTLRNRHPDIDFTDCYMNPIMRKSGLTPDQLMRRQLYSLLKPMPIEAMDSHSINIIGNNFATDKDCELITILSSHDYTIKEITDCSTYDEYLSMSKSTLNITYNPIVTAAADALKLRLNQEHLYLPISYNYDEIKANLDKLMSYLKLEAIDCSSYVNECEVSLNSLKELITDTPVAIDYTATMRPLSLAKLLLEHEINVISIYADSFTSEDHADFDYIVSHYPQLTIYPTVHHSMRVKDRSCPNRLVAIGQKAAYFTGTNHFVNIVENGGLYGYKGIVKICELISDAYLNEKDTKQLIQIKGLGCECVL